MNAPLFCLVLASLLLAPAHGVDPPAFKNFKKMHTYNDRNRPFDCTQVMNNVQMHLTYCKPCNNVILGYTTDITPLNDVINICNGQGTQQGHNNFRSNTNFRTVKCRLQNRNAVPPHCIYTGTIQSSRITVGCSQYLPVHFETC
ncbi:hypothetical protein NL108_012423 [Boleophthalmus pectinirostris]|uniref:ribonuclease pancreatic-like n=1 Tax=Boleophthalmus pectinirostris TaxID=150288 RepID=UPI00242DB9EE|nr:ribonuclease pancreatic-like [Boleophthalmus pectinirostris]KAJ0066386.1 hypothetical protein NL108_012423 [Boleophthalmus pectinirostris]